MRGLEMRGCLEAYPQDIRSPNVRVVGPVALRRPGFAHIHSIDWGTDRHEGMEGKGWEGKGGAGRR